MVQFGPTTYGIGAIVEIDMVTCVLAAGAVCLLIVCALVLFVLAGYLALCYKKNQPQNEQEEHKHDRCGDARTCVVRVC